MSAEHSIPTHPYSSDLDLSSANATPQLFPEAEDLSETGIGRLVSSENTIHIDATWQYLQDINQFKLLTAEEEIDLAKVIEAGKAAEEALITATRPSPEEQASLQPVIAAGQTASIRMIESNLRLVVSVVKRYTNRGVPLLDLIQEGNLGLARAVEKFDYTLGFKFSTYATWWIRQAATRALANDSRTIRTPIHVTDRLSKVDKAINTLTQKLERHPTAKEIANHLKDGTTANQVEEALKARRMQPLSFSTTYGDNDDLELGDTIADPDHDPNQATSDISNKILIQELIKKAGLKPPEILVLKLRYGLPCNGKTETQKDSTLEEVGTRMGLTRERARQIETQALSKLKRHMKLKKITRE